MLTRTSISIIIIPQKARKLNSDNVSDNVSRINKNRSTDVVKRFFMVDDTGLEPQTPYNAKILYTINCYNYVVFAFLFDCISFFLVYRF